VTWPAAGDDNKQQAGDWGGSSQRQWGQAGLDRHNRGWRKEQRDVRV